MKVGEILKGDIKNIRGLKYPFKIIINEKCKYPKKQIIENEIYLENCNTFLNDFHFYKIDQRHQSFSSKKNMYNSNVQENQNKLLSNSFKKFFLRTNINKFEKSLKKSDNFPLLGETSSTPKAKTKIKLITSYQKQTSSLFNENSTIKNKIKIKKLKTLNNDNNKTSLIVSDRKKGVTPTYQFRRIGTLKIEDFFNSKNKKNNNIKIQLMPNILEFRLQNKIKKINNIIDKLNSPIFINIKKDMN